MTKGYLRRGLAAALLGAATAASPSVLAGVDALEVTTPREFGYVIGDTFEHELRLVLGGGFELDPASIPEPGRVGRWLSLNETVHEDESRGGTSRHTIRLRFQVVNAGQSVIGAGTPPMRLRILGPEGDFPVVVPAWGFTVGPILAPEERPLGQVPDLRPAHAPAPISTTARTLRVAALGVLAAGLLVVIVRAILAGRFGQRAGGHFERAYRRLRRRTRGPQPSGAYAEALVEIHAAFNATAGRAVFRHDLARFFAEHPRFEPLAARIESLFAESGALFYGGGGESPSGDRGVERLRDLCRACRDAERGRRGSPA